MSAALVLGLLLACSGCDQRHVAAGALALDGELSVATQLAVLRGRELAQRVSRRLGVPAELRLDEVVRARRRGESPVIEVEVRDADERRAVLLCDALIETYVERRRELRRERGLDGDARLLETCVSRR